VVMLANTEYAGANHTHLSELLRDREGIDLSRQTVHRQRMPQAGMLVQIDGSRHPWLEERGPRFVLLLAVDDATGIVVNAVFRPEEDTRGYFILIRGLIERWGVPLALCCDRHGTFRFSGRPRHIQPPVKATHFSRAMVELGIRQIFARSPQAKGRVERMAGTFQDRLVTELRLAGAESIDDANAILQEFMPRYNAQFAVPAELAKPAYRAWNEHRPLNEVLCFKHPRRVDRDNTVKHQWHTLQLLPGIERLSYAGVQVEVLEHVDGRLQVRYEGDIIPHRHAPLRPGVLRAISGALAPTPEMARIVKRLGNHRLSQRQLERLASLHLDRAVEDPLNDDGEPKPQDRRRLTPRQLALWKAVQQAKGQGFSLRETARQLGISRNTVRKYARALTQPTNRPVRRQASRQPELAASRPD